MGAETLPEEGGDPAEQIPASATPARRIEPSVIVIVPSGSTMWISCFSARSSSRV